MVENLKQFYDRGVQLDSLEEKANELQRESSYLHLTSKQVKTSKLRKQTKIIIALIFSLFIIILMSLSFEDNLNMARLFLYEDNNIFNFEMNLLNIYIPFHELKIKRLDTIKLTFFNL